MAKLLAFLALQIMALMVAGAFGVFHDQISYTVSPEYFTRFKFIQFSIDGLALSDRVRAGLVGFLASWWMGIPIGLLVGGAGFMHRGARRMLAVTLESFALITAVTLLVGLSGLVYGFFETATIDPADYGAWFISRGVTDPRRFLCAGYMHNASYLGGALAVPVAWAYHLVCRRRDGALKG